MQARPASIKVRALQWLTQREHSRPELRSKLLHLLARCAPDAAAPDAAPTNPAAQVDVLLDWLAAHGHLSETRFVESRVQARQARFGNLRIQQELKQHGLRLDPDAQQTLRQTEAQRATEVWRKKYGQPAIDATQRVRQMRFLAGRGFSSDVVRQVVLGAGRNDDSAESLPL